MNPLSPGTAPLDFFGQELNVGDEVVLARRVVDPEATYAELVVVRVAGFYKRRDRESGHGWTDTSALIIESTRPCEPGETPAQSMIASGYTVRIDHG